MKCLILGGNGFIGSHLADRLLAEGHEVRIFDKFEEHYRKPNAEIEYCFGDFGNRGLVADAIEGMDIVFHLISTTLPKTSNDDPVFDIQSNVIETIFLLEQCVNKVKKIVYLSSGGTIYGNPAMLPISEDSPTNPECSYGITKLTIEKYFALFAHLHGLDYSILRASNPYGSRQNPFGIQGAISVFLGKVAKNQKVEIWGDGGIVRDYVFIDDLVDGIYKAAILNTQDKIFNLGSGQGHSLNDLLDIIRRVTETEVLVEYKTKRNFDIQEIYLDTARAKEQLGWTPVTPLKTGIKNTWQFVKSLQNSSNAAS